MAELPIDKVESKVSDGKIFKIVFRKRTDGTIRSMIARTGVKKYLKGGTLGYDAHSKGLIPVFDMRKRQYRSISVDDIHELYCHGMGYFFPVAGEVENV